MAPAPSAGPVRRNFAANGHPSKRKGGGVTRLVFLALIALVVGLSALAVHLSRQMVQSTSSTASESADAPSERAKAVAVAPPAANNIAASKDSNDRVYCSKYFHSLLQTKAT